MEERQDNEADKAVTIENSRKAEESIEQLETITNVDLDTPDESESGPSTKAVLANSTTPTLEAEIESDCLGTSSSSGLISRLGSTSTTTTIPKAERTETTTPDPDITSENFFNSSRLTATQLDLQDSDNTSSGLRVPPWFLENNVKIVTDLAESPKVVEVVSGQQSARTEKTKNGKKKKNGKKRTDGKFQVSHDFYSQLRDATQACLPNQYIKEEWLEDNPTLLVQVPLPGGIDFLSALVEELARDLGAHLISLNAEDISDLGYDFALVEKPTHIVFSDAYTACSSYFGTACSTHSSHNAALIENATAAILASSKLKMCNPANSGTSSQGEPSLAQSSQAQIPLILHLKDAKEISQLPRGTKTLRAFRTAVQKLRKKEQPVLLIASMYSKGVDKDVSDTTFEQIYRKIMICQESIIEVSPLKSVRSKEVLALAEGKHIREVNFRRLRRMLRCMLRADLQAQCLSSWMGKAILDSSALSWVSDKAIWPEGFLQRSVRQIAGRFKSDSILEIADAGEVVLRLSRASTMKDKSADAGELGEGSLTEGSPSARRTKFKAKLDQIKETCNTHETALIEGVVDTEHINVSFDDICVDQEIVDGLKRLITLSIIRPDIMSYGALSQSRITGAMLYGPPGTGKTHLARAVARSSGANMLVVSGSNILSQYIGETEKLIKAIFSLAMKLKPCVIFLDEADGFLRGRTSKDESWQRTQINQFLQEWDGLGSVQQSPFVLIATNRPGDLDDAVIRRLPQKYYLGLPDQETRLAILKIVLKDESLGIHMSIETVAAATAGFSGSDLRSLCVLAALLCESEAHHDPLSPNASGSSPRRVLQAQHFAKALEKTKRTVSKESLSEVIKFAMKYDQNCAVLAETEPQTRSSRFSIRSLFSWKRKS